MSEPSASEFKHARFYEPHQATIRPGSLRRGIRAHPDRWVAACGTCDNGEILLGPSVAAEGAGTPQPKKGDNDE